MRAYPSGILSTWDDVAGGPTRATSRALAVDSPTVVSTAQSADRAWHVSRVQLGSKGDVALVTCPPLATNRTGSNTGRPQNSP